MASARTRPTKQCSSWPLDRNKSRRCNTPTGGPSAPSVSADIPSCHFLFPADPVGSVLNTAMTRHLDSKELDVVSAMAGGGKTAADTHRAIARLRARRGESAPTVDNIRKAMRNKSYKRSGAETRGRKRKITPVKLRALDKVRKDLQKECDGRAEITLSKIQKPARLKAHPSTVPGPQLQNPIGLICVGLCAGLLVLGVCGTGIAPNSFPRSARHRALKELGVKWRPLREKPMRSAPAFLAIRGLARAQNPGQRGGASNQKAQVGRAEPPAPVVVPGSPGPFCRLVEADS